MLTTPFLRIEIACKDAAEAAAIAELLISCRLAACVQSLPITSRYHWQGEVEQADEVLLIAKSRAELFEALCKAVREAHSYDVPEITATAMAAIDADYGAWLTAETKNPA